MQRVNRTALTVSYSLILFVLLLRTPWTHYVQHCVCPLFSTVYFLLQVVQIQRHNNLEFLLNHFSKRTRDNALFYRRRSPDGPIWTESSWRPPRFVFIAVALTSCCERFHMNTSYHLSMKLYQSINNHLNNLRLSIDTAKYRKTCICLYDFVIDRLLSFFIYSSFSGRTPVSI